MNRLQMPGNSFRRFAAAVSGCFFAVFVVGGVSAADWGDLSATFVLDGSPPKPKPIAVTKDPEYCGKHELVNEQLVVNAQNKGIANVVVFLYQARGEKAPPIHDSYKELQSSKVKIDNKNCRFEPRVVGLRTTQTLVAGNSDTVGHNTNVATLTPGNPSPNVLIAAGGNFELTFPKGENLPATVTCNIHPWMKGYIVIKDHPYIGVSDKDGKVSIKNLPAGKWTFQFWQEASGYITTAKVKGKDVTWARGRAELEIKAGANDLGEVKVPLSMFKLQ